MIFFFNSANLWWSLPYIMAIEKPRSHSSLLLPPFYASLWIHLKRVSLSWLFQFWKCFFSLTSSHPNYHCAGSGLHYFWIWSPQIHSLHISMEMSQYLSRLTLSWFHYLGEKSSKFLSKAFKTFYNLDQLTSSTYYHISLLPNAFYSCHTHLFMLPPIQNLVSHLHVFGPVNLFFQCLSPPILLLKLHTFLRPT